MIIVLGGGPAGRIASIRLASAGKDVRLIEHGGIGGQCLHFGCMPVCALNDVARQLYTARALRTMGIFDSIPRLDFPALVQEMHAIQAKIAAILDTETRAAGVDIIYGKTGRIEGNSVFLGEEKIAADNVIAATGSHPYVPDIPGAGLAGVFTSHSLTGMKMLPENLTIIGGGIMAAEFAFVFHAFGCHVTILCRSTFLKNLDRHLRVIAYKDLSGVSIRENTCVDMIKGRSKVNAIQISDRKGSEELDADMVLLAAGLVPRSEMLDGLEKGPLGEVIVNNRMQTNVPDVYACGDVTGPPYLTPVARQQGIVAADNILGKPRTMDMRYIPQSISLSRELAFCIPEDSEMASLAIPGPAGPGTFWSVPSGDTGLAKIFMEPENGEIGGVCVAGPGGGLITSYMAFLMKHHFSVQDFEEFIEVHPSTDGVSGLAKYASELLKNRNFT